MPGPKPALRRRASLLLTLCSLTMIGMLLSAPVPGMAADEFGPESGDDPGRMVLLLDSSGSMSEQATAGVTKIEAAKQALGQVVEQLPDDAEVGIRVFGAKVFSRKDPGACTDTQNVVPVGPLDRDALTAAVDDYQPYGETPIGNALKAAADDLGPAQEGEPRTVVLLSDGEPTCQPDPCKVAADLADRGIDLSINVVGLDVSGGARSALQCIARAGNGEYYDAASAQELSNSLVKVSVRALRGFRLLGEAVEGGTSSDVPLALEAGTYVDTSLSDELPRYYVVDQPPGGGVAASVLVRPPSAEENWSTVARVKLLTPDGVECASSYSLSFQVLGMTPITSTGAEYNQFSARRSEVCDAADQLLLAVTVDALPVDYRLAVSTFAAVDNAETLPGPVESGGGPWVDKISIPASEERVPVVGGVTFDDAVELTPGTTYADTVRPTEQLVYKVPVDYGQAVRFGARIGTDPQASELLGVLGPHVTLDAYSGLGQLLPLTADSERGITHNGFYTGEEPQLLSAAIAPVRPRNAESSDGAVTTVTHGGYHYFVLGMGRGAAEQSQFAAPVALRAEVVGEVEGVPEFVGDEDSDAGLSTPSSGATTDAADVADGTEAAATDDDAPAASERSLLPWIAGGLGLVILLLATFLLGRRSRRQS